MRAFLMFQCDMFINSNVRPIAYPFGFTQLKTYMVQLITDRPANDREQCIK